MLSNISKSSLSYFKSLSTTSYFTFSHAKLSHIYYESSNKNTNTNLIVLHGLFGSAQNFRSIVKNPKISDHANSYLVDLRNHGNSEHKDTMSMEEMANDVHNFIKENNLDSRNVVIMGHSMGAKVTMAFASLFHNLPKGVVVVDYAPYNYLNDPKFGIVKETGNMI